MDALELMRLASIPVEGVFLVGANKGTEWEAYRDAGATTCVYVEPIASVFEVLKANVGGVLGHIPVQAVCSDREGDEVSFGIASNEGLSSSMLPLGRHSELYPHIVYVGWQPMTTTTADNVLRRAGAVGKVNLMVIDTQGAELKVLKGATETLRDLDALYIEVSETPLYEGGCTHHEITTFLKAHDFHPKWMYLHNDGAGDAFYRKRRSILDLPTYDGNKALGRPATQSSLSIWSTPEGANGGVNGHKTGAFGFHTEKEENPWWQVDLGKRVEIREIRVYNRVNAETDRAASMQILASSDLVDWHLVHDQRGRVFGGADGRPLRVVQDISARGVRLQLSGLECFHLDEVEIY